MIKAIIFDFFGVLGVRGSESFRQAYVGDDTKKSEKIRSLQDKLGLGSIGYDDYISALSKISGVDRGTVLQYTEDYQPNLELLEYIRSGLKPKYKIGIISNAGADWVLRILGSSNMKMFDDIILSYKVRFIKPNPEIYNMSAKNLGVKEQECIFIDDISPYCEGAEAVGMKSIRYRNFKQMKTELEQILE